MSRSRVALIVIVAALGVCAVFFSVGPGKALRTFWKHGVIQAAVQDPKEDREYAASREANLRAIRVALNLYEASEDRYPLGAGWMDVIRTRLRTTDMSDAEASKKLVRPNLAAPHAGEFGYELNDSAAGKYRGDLKDPHLVLVFESSNLSRNAHGSPANELGLMGITLSGEIVQL